MKELKGKEKVDKYFEMGKDPKVKDGDRKEMLDNFTDEELEILASRIQNKTGKAQILSRKKSNIKKAELREMKDKAMEIAMKAHEGQVDKAECLTLSIR